MKALSALLFAAIAANLSGCAAIGAIKCQFASSSDYVNCINGAYGTKIETQKKAKKKQDE